MQGKNPAGTGLPVFNRLAEGGKRLRYLLLGLVQLVAGGLLVYWALTFLAPHVQGALRFIGGIVGHMLRQWLG